MLDALGTATQGAHAALQSFDQAASQVAKAGTNAVAQVTSTSATTPAQSDGLQSGIVKAVVQMSQAETNYSANAKVIETVDRLAGETLDILA
jgi:flagellar hook protein FlgE